MACRFSCTRYTEIERRRAKQKGLEAARKGRRRQRRHPRVQLKFHLVMVAPDGRVCIHMSAWMEIDPQVQRATLLLSAVLEHMVRGQQLDMLTASAGAALPQQPPCGASQRQSRSMPQQAAIAGRTTSCRGAPARKPQRVVLARTAREVFGNPCPPPAIAGADG